MRDGFGLLLATVMLSGSSLASAADLGGYAPPPRGGVSGAYGPDTSRYGFDPEYDPPAYRSGRPARRLTTSPDYAGSDYGLGKPSFYGMVPRPDWGRSSVD